MPLPTDTRNHPFKHKNDYYLVRSLSICFFKFFEKEFKTNNFWDNQEGEEVDRESRLLTFGQRKGQMTNGKGNNVRRIALLNLRSLGLCHLLINNLLG